MELLGPMTKPSLSFRNAAIALGVSLLLCFFVYSSTFRAGFNLDDHVLILDNPAMSSPEGLLRIWSSTDQWDYWPLTYTAYWIQYQIWGDRPLPYHLVNIFLHALNAWLLYLFLRRLAIPAAWLGAAIFAAHPIMVESVAWIAELKNVLSALFLLLAALSFLRFDEGGARRAYLASLVLFVAALLSKASTVMLPPALLLLLWWKHGEVRKKVGLALVPHFALALIAGLVTIWFGFHRAGAGENRFEANLIERVSIAGKSIWFYFGQFLAPNPSFAYPRWTEQPRGIDFLPAAAAIVAFLILWRSRKGWAKPWILGLGVYFLMLVPVLGFVGAAFFRISFVADHFVYLSMMGIAPLFASGIHAIGAKWGKESWVALSGIGIVALLGVSSWNSAQRFESKATLFQATNASDPSSWFPHLGLGLLAKDRRDLEKAQWHFQEALRLNPQSLSARNDLGSVLYERQRFEDAEDCWLAVLAEDPENAPANFCLGNLRSREGRNSEAIEHFRRALATRPIWALAHRRLGETLASLGQWAQAEQALRESLRISPTKEDGHFALAQALRQQGKHNEALASFRKATEIEPRFAQAWWGLSQSFESLGRKKEAELPAIQALELARTWGDVVLEKEIQDWLAKSRR